VTTPLLTVEHVHKWFRRIHVLCGLNLTIEQGQVVCVLGPSGAGKSTLLRCINHLETIDAGAIRLRDQMVGYEMRRRGLYERRERDVATIRARIGMVFQHFNLFGHLTVLDNVTFGPVRVKHIPTSVARDRAIQVLRRVGLEERLSAYPSQLSGGQQQRVAIARALAMDPELILFDEPTSALDPELVHEVLSVMHDLAESGMTMLVVTHELSFARDVADEVVIMADGRVVESGPAAEVLVAPRTERAARFLGQIQREVENKASGEVEQ
jgi:polar amino acid transport system ATP-binding protein